MRRVPGLADALWNPTSFFVLSRKKRVFLRARADKAVCLLPSSDLVNTPRQVSFAVQAGVQSERKQKKIQTQINTIKDAENAVTETIGENGNN